MILPCLPFLCFLLTAYLSWRSCATNTLRKSTDALHSCLTDTLVCHAGSVRLVEPNDCHMALPARTGTQSTINYHDVTLP
ncbi:hypothetical protein HDV57DRAFT_487351 [Trichoderma longibrachiatum]